MVDIAALLESIRVIFTNLYPVIASKAWLDYEPEARLKLAEVMSHIDNMWTGNATKQLEGLRPMWDQAIYPARKNGKLPADFPHIRAERNSGKKEDKPAPTVEDLFAALVGTTPVVDTPTTDES